MVEEGTKQQQREHEIGFSLVEIILGLTLLTIGLLGFVGAIVSTQVLVRVTKEKNIANAAIISTMEEFREACATDFVAAVTTYQNGANLSPDRLMGMGEGANMVSVVVLDENTLNPPIDLNGNGVFVDNIPLADVATLNAAVLRVRVAWTGVRGPMEIEYTTILAKGEF
jgi:type II secretory pathway pseudopilin PulG